MNPHYKKKGVTQLGSMQSATKRDVADAIDEAQTTERGVPVDPTATVVGSGVTSVAGKIGVVLLDAADVSETAGLKILTSTERTKLSGIETSATADQTNAEIRAAVEAATDSNIFTDAENTKLDGVTAWAKPDQTAAEIRVLVDAATDSNVFTDADHTKLDAIGESSGWVNVKDHGAVGDGATNDDAAIKLAISATRIAGGIHQVKLSGTVSGFGTPSNVPATAWAARQAVTLTGTMAGSGFAAVGNINEDGYLTSIAVTAPGSGYKTLSYPCARTASSAIITLSSGTFDTDIVTGVAVRHESTGYSCKVLTRDSSTQLTLTENMTFSNTDEFAFGLPWATHNAVDYPDIMTPIVGDPMVLHFPPGTYLTTTGGFSNFTGLSNLTVIATGATFLQNTDTEGQPVAIRNSVGVDWIGGDMRCAQAKYQNPFSETVQTSGVLAVDSEYTISGYTASDDFTNVGAASNANGVVFTATGTTPTTYTNSTTLTRTAVGRSVRYGGQMGMSVSASQWVNLRDVKIFNSPEFGLSISADAASGRYHSREVRVDGLEVTNPLGDGVHVGSGSQRVTVNRARIIHPGDDALACVGDSGMAYEPPTDVRFTNCEVVGGIYRGCVAIASVRCSFSNIIGNDTHGPFCWAMVGQKEQPEETSFTSIVALNLGNTAESVYDTTSGIGIRAEGTGSGDHMEGLVVRDCVFTRHSTAAAQTIAIFNIVPAWIDDLDWDAQIIEAIGPSQTQGGVLNTDLVLTNNLTTGFAFVVLPVGIWDVQASVVSRSSTGAYYVMWAVFHDGTSEINGGAAAQEAPATRSNLPVQAIIEVITGTKTIGFKIKIEASLGNQIDAGIAYGPNSRIIARRIG